MTSINLGRKSLLVFLVAAAMAIAAPAQTFTSFSFDGSDGSGPGCTGTGRKFLRHDRGGGDLNCNPPDGCGTVFKVTPKGKLTTLHIFEETDGMSPFAGLILASDKNFYGTTDLGGDLIGCAPRGCGTVFRMTPDGVLTTLHTFELTDGLAPVAPLLQATDGNLYGTTVDGSSSSEGTVFKMSLQGALTTIYNFCPNAPDCADGNEPSGGLVQTTDGSFYGTTSAGGDIGACYGQGCGGVFRLTAGGHFAVVHKFEGPGGAIPRAGLVLGNDGSLYGTTIDGGSTDQIAGEPCSRSTRRESLRAFSASMAPMELSLMLR